MPHSRIFESLSTLLVGPILVFGTLALLDLSLKIDPPHHRAVNVTAGSAHARAPLGTGFEGNEPARGVVHTAVQSVSEKKRVLHIDELRTRKPVRTVMADRNPEQSTDAATEPGAGFVADELARGVVHTAVQSVSEKKRVLHIDELRTRKPVRTVMADRAPEQSADAAIEPGAGFGADELAGVQTAVQSVSEKKRVHQIDALQTQEPVRTVAASRDPGHAVLAETLEEDGEAPKETAKQPAASPAKDLHKKVEQRRQDSRASGRQDTPASAVRPKKKPATPSKPAAPSRAQQQRKSPPSGWKALSLGSAKDALPKKAKTDRVGARDYNMRVWSRIARHKPRLGRGGSTTVTFGIGGNGMPRAVRVGRSSGDVRLDNLAMATVRKAAPFPKPPPGVGSRPFTVRIYFR